MLVMRTMLMWSGCDGNLEGSNPLPRLTSDVRQGTCLMLMLLFAVAKYNPAGGGMLTKICNQLILVSLPSTIIVVDVLYDQLIS